MINLRNSPFLWIALALVCAYKLADYFTPGMPSMLRVLILAMSGVCALLTVRKYSPKWQYISTCVLGVMIVCAGLIRKADYSQQVFPDEPLGSAIYCSGIFRVSQVLKNKGNSVSIHCAPLAVFDIKSGNRFPDPDRHLLVSIRTTRSLIVLPGDTLKGEGWLSPISPPLNPHAFDARHYYKTLGIRHQFSCKQEKIKICHFTGSSIPRLAAQWQSGLSSKVRENISPQVAQLTNALVWGDRADMDAEVIDAFADSGAMHVLSVSGMHVAIVYSMLLLIIGPPGAGQFRQRALRFVGYSAAIMLYTLLTGASPAVVRAGLMIMLFLFGKCFSLSIQVWNLLGFAAFVMMWIHPFMYENIGFQLSFLAMGGLLMFAKPITRSLHFKNLLLHRCWEITAVSIAAQIFILPVLLSQFHQFPLTFILSSIVAVPAGYAVIAGALLNVTLSVAEIHLLWPLLDWSGKMFIDSMKWMAGLNPLMHYALPPFSANMLMAMCIIFSFAVVFRLPAIKRVSWAFGMLVMVSLSCHRHQQWNTNEVIIYHSYKGLIIDVFDAGQCHSILDCSLHAAGIEFPTRGHRCYKDIISANYICKDDSIKTKAFEYESFSFRSLKQKFVLLNEANVCNELFEYAHVIIDECLDPSAITGIDGATNSTFILPAHLKRDCKNYIKDFLKENNIPLIDMETHGYVKLAL